MIKSERKSKTIVQDQVVVVVICVSISNSVKSSTTNTGLLSRLHVLFTRG